MSSCKKTPNPCKICLQTVTRRSGLQCKGACESWVHYACLNYTPGKIRDIRAGLIVVTCPCPDCKTGNRVPKEILVNQPYSCKNAVCPANLTPTCEHVDCQANEEQEYSLPLSNVRQAVKCGRQCQEYTMARVYSRECMPVSAYHSSESTRSRPIPGGKCGIAAVEKMCHTVGELSKQLNQLMEAMRDDTKCGGECYHTTRNLCPNPCNCPGNSGSCAPKRC